MTLYTIQLHRALAGISSTYFKQLPCNVPVESEGKFVKRAFQLMFSFLLHPFTNRPVDQLSLSTYPVIRPDRSDDLLCPFRSFQKTTEKQEQKREAIFIGLAHTY